MGGSLSSKEKLQKYLFEKSLLIKSNEFPLIITFEELLNIIKNIPDNGLLKILNDNKSIISKILSNVDKFIKITIANINSDFRSVMKLIISIIMTLFWCYIIKLKSKAIKLIK